MANTDDLITQLSSKAAAVPAMASPATRLASWTLGAVIYVALLLAFIGIRGDLLTQLGYPVFLFEILLLAAITISAALSSLWLGYPDGYQQSSGKLMLPVMFTLALFGFMLFQLATNLTTQIQLNTPHLGCIFCVMAYASLPAFFVLYHLRKMASTRGSLASGIALLSAASLGALALRLAEPAASIGHVLVWHNLPLLMLALLGYLLGRYMLRW